ncbi:MAG TPA: hypothetical protein PKZ22_02525 [Accumulibacter sp.]|jgi:hypothetical protein|nr:hypothetical protein [Accumulibacter sp.]
MAYWSPNSKLPLLLMSLAAMMLGALGFLAWQHFFPVSAASGWSYSVYLDNLPHVSALARDRQGVLYVSQELSQGRGILFKREDDGRLSAVLNGLSKPDGLASFGDGVAVTQEGGEQPVLWLHGGKVDTLFRGVNLEGIVGDGRHLYAIEDRPGDGRLLRFDSRTGEVSVLRDGLLESEGVAVCPDGQLYYAEKGRNWVKRFKPGGGDEIVMDRLKAPGFVLCDEEGLWVTEDLTHRARLLLLDKSGKTLIILKGLRSGQTILPLASGHFLVAEQGRGRVLEVWRSAD